MLFGEKLPSLSLAFLLPNYQTIPTLILQVTLLSRYLQYRILQLSADLISIVIVFLYFFNTFFLFGLPRGPYEFSATNRYKRIKKFQSTVSQRILPLDILQNRIQIGETCISHVCELSQLD